MVGKPPYKSYMSKLENLQQTMVLSKETQSSFIEIATSWMHQKYTRNKRLLILQIMANPFKCYPTSLLPYNPHNG